MSNFVVSARKYRPVRFDEVVGQQHVSQTLKNALQNNQLAHAFLFCGPRGVGKTTCARILAKVLNCQNLSADHEACNACDSCNAFNENASFNITELDAASNNSVEHIRALIEQVRFQPQQGKYKVFIIDEVHMLSQQAFNAFLKTLEEPPPYAIFILATTEKHKIIPTILSRCQIFDFRRIQVADMVKHLQEICQKENIEASKDALHIIGQKADGALRDALSIFDRIVSSVPQTEGAKQITYEHVIENLNVLDYDYFFRMVDALLVEDVSQIMLLFDDILKKGFEADIFINGLAEHLRNLLVCRDEKTLSLLQVSEGLRERYLEQARLSPESLLLTALNLANDCDVNYKMARNKRLHVEMVLIKMAYIQRAIQYSQPTTSVAAQTIPEKKTPDLSTPSSATAPQVMEKKESPTSASPMPEKTPESAQKVETPKEVAEPVVATGSPAPSPAETPKINSGLMSQHGTPSLKNFDLLEAELDEEEAEQNEADQPVDLQELEALWKKYGEAATSPSVRNTLLNKVELAVEEQQIKVLVGSTMTKQMIQEEKELMSHLREALKRPNLSMQITIDPSKRDTEPVVKPKKALTVKEKYDLMRQTNPLVEEIQKRFGLKPDYD